MENNAENENKNEMNDLNEQVSNHDFSDEINQIQNMLKNWDNSEKEEQITQVEAEISPEIKEENKETLEDEEKHSSAAQQPAEEEKENKQETPSLWEEVKEDNSVVKKYIIYISKDFIPLMDSKNADERSAYINDAIQQKLDRENLNQQRENKKRIKINLIIGVIVFLLFIPLGLMIANKAIMVTFANYKYSQDNFEKLYKQRFVKDRAYMRSVEYNRTHKAKKPDQEKK